MSKYGYHHNILIDPRTSCSKHEAAAILLNRRTYDPIYRDLNPDEDPEERDAQFMDWLDISIFDELLEDRNGVLAELDDARDENDQAKIDACRKRVVECDDTIRRAKQILCDIDDELAKGALSELRAVSVQNPDTFYATPPSLGDMVNELAKGAILKSRPVSTYIAELSSTTQITLSSLREWSSDRDYLKLPLDATPAQPVPPAPTVDAEDEPLLTKKGGMTPTSTKSFLVTFAVLLEEFLKLAGSKFGSTGGEDMNLKEVASLLSEKSLKRNDKRKGVFLDRQGVSTIEERIKTVVASVIDESSKAAIAARGKTMKGKSKIATP